MSGERLYGADAVARHLRVPTSTVQWLVDAGLIPSVDVGRVRLVDVGSADEFIGRVADQVEARLAQTPKDLL